MMKTLIRSVLLLCLAVLLTGALFAQSSAGTVGGRVLDPSGAAIAGARVRIVNEVDQQARTFETSGSGDFTFPQLAPGDYTLSVEMTGFKKFEKTHVHLAASDVVDVGTVHLDVGAVSETVEVSATSAVVETTTGERSALIDSREVNNLMARGRDVMAMLQILPGVVDDNTGSDVLGAFNTPTMSGMRNNYNSLTVDGISGNTARGSNAQSPINLDAISEVKVFANSYPAEIGPSASGAILLATKGGTQYFHGGVYYYNRNEAFNANSFLNNRATPFVPRQRYRYNTVGDNLGGPIYIPGHFNTSKQKLFFFFSQEIDPNQTPIALANFTVPTALERQGNFSQSYKNATTLYTVKDPTTGAAFPGNIVPTSRIDANSAKLLSVFPLPNAVDPKYGYNFQIAGTEDTPVHQEILKVDYNVNDKLKMWFRASGYKSDSTGLNSAAINNKWGPAPVDYQQTMPNIGVNATYVFSPTLINEATFGINLWTESQVLTKEGLTAYQRATYGINIPQTYPSQNPLGLLPAMSFGGVTGPAQISYDGRFPMVDDSMSYTFRDSITKVWRTHVFKAGFQYQHAQYNQYHQAGNNSFPGSFAFGNDSANPNDSGYAYANAILGNFDTYQETTNRVDYAPITTVIEWFVQDTWKITRRFTLTPGIRFTDALPLSPANNNAANFVPYLYNPAQAPVLYRPVVQNGQKVTINPITGEVVLPVYAGLIVPGSGNPTNGIIQPNTPGYPKSMVYSNGVLPAPRLGFAWDVFGDGKMALRGGAGIFYTNLVDAGTLGNLFFNPPAIYNPTAYYGKVATAANTTGLLSPSSFSRDIDPHGKTNTAYQMNIGIQRDIGFKTIVDVAYVGSFGRHLGENWQMNLVPYGAEFLPQNQNPQTNTPLNDNYFRPFMGYANIPQQIYVGNSSYHSLQVAVNRRVSHGLEFGVAYTHSKAMDYAEGDSTTSVAVATFLDRKTYDYGLAGYDRPNILTFHFLYDVPKMSPLFKRNKIAAAILDNWRVSDITSFISGAPTTISLTTSPTNLLGGGDPVRALMVGDPNSGAKTFDQWFNPAAFTAPSAPGYQAACAKGTCPALTFLNLGNAPQMPVRRPGTNNWNTSLYKEFKVKERLNFQFRAEAYNTFNHTQFSNMNTSFTFDASGNNTNKATGQITAVRDARVMQLALRLMF
jgi:hypothetical protein